MTSHCFSKHFLPNSEFSNICRQLFSSILFQTFLASPVFSNFPKITLQTLANDRFWDWKFTSLFVTDITAFTIDGDLSLYNPSPEFNLSLIWTLSNNATFDQRWRAGRTEWVDASLVIPGLREKSFSTSPPPFTRRPVDHCSGSQTTIKSFPQSWKLLKR